MTGAIANAMTALGTQAPSLPGIAFRRPSSAVVYSLAANIFNIRYGVTSITYSESNQRAACAAGGLTAILTVPKGLAFSGLFALEFEIMVMNSTIAIGITDLASLADPATVPINTATGWGYYSDGTKITNSVAVAYGASWAAGAKMGIVLDARGATCSLSFWKNGADQGVAYSGLTGSFIWFFCEDGATNADVRVSSALSYAYGGATQAR